MFVLVDKNNKVLKYPYTMDNLKEDNRHVTFSTLITDDELSEFGVYRVNGQPPELDAYVKVEESEPQYKNGAWIRVFNTRDATEEEVQEMFDYEANKVKSRRIDLLKECDWTMLPDADLTDTEIAEWKKYRQALRDISTAKGYPWKVTWPKLPNITAKTTPDSPE